MTKLIDASELMLAIQGSINAMTQLNDREIQSLGSHPQFYKGMIAGLNIFLKELIKEAEKSANVQK